MCVSPVLARRSIPVPAAALGPRTTRVRLRTGQLCLGSHFSVTEGADHGAEAGPKSVPANPSPASPCLRAQETPPGLPRPHPNLGIAAAVCASRFQGRPRASPPPLRSFSAESLPLPPGTAARLAAPSVCVCVFTFEGVPLALCYGICLCFCLSIVRVGVCKA